VGCGLGRGCEVSTTNYHENLKTLILVLERGQEEETFESTIISVFPDHIAFIWEDADSLRLDVEALAKAAASIDMKATVMHFGESMAVELWPITQAEGGAG
jgi:hypothetical protein